MSQDRKFDRRTLMAGAVALSGLAAAPRIAHAEDVIAATKSGKVRGSVENGIRVFRSVRYGADTGSYRFQPPRAPKPWSGVEDALKFRNQAAQVGRGRAGEAPDSEDCLFLHVWTPALRDGKKRPIMVWLHGGSFTQGSGMSPVYNGTHLAKRGDVVVVTVNHRLNAFGYTYLNGVTKDPRYQDSSNVGQLDIMQALQWVRDNAHEFGGDAGNVMLFGQSGGATKTAFILGSERSKGLIHRASLESGSPLFALPAEKATGYTKTMMRHLGLKDGDVEGLAKVPMAKLIEAQKTLGDKVAYRPVKDGRSLTRDPFAHDAPPWIADIPLMINTNKYEETSLEGARHPDLFNIGWDQVADRVSKPYMQGADLKPAVAELRAANPQAKPSDIVFLALTLWRFRKEATIAAENKVKQGKAPIYMSYFTFESGSDGGKWKSHHAFDNAFVFDNVDAGWTSPQARPAQQKLADMMSASWIAFARKGDPNNPAIPHWPAYNTQTRPTMVFDGTAHVVNDPDARERKVAMGLPTIVF